MKKLALFAVLLLVLTPVGSVSAQSAKKHKIGALTKSLANPYFLRMKEGYEYAQKKLDVNVVFASTPGGETDQKLGQPLLPADVEQLNFLQNWVTEGSMEGLIVTPFRPASLNSALATVSRKDIPIINIDEIIPEEVANAYGIKIVTRIASNNVEVGNLDAQLVIKSVPKGSDVAVVEGDPVTTSSIDRVKGFTDTAKEGGLKVVASRPANWDRKKAHELAEKILTDHPNLKAIFAANDDMALGVVNAVQAAGASRKVIVVGVDATPDALEAVKQGLLAGTVAQYPEAMAYVAVETMVKKLNGETVPEKIDSPIKLITNSNLSDAGKYYQDE